MLFLAGSVPIPLDLGSHFCDLSYLLLILRISYPVTSHAGITRNVANLSQASQAHNTNMTRLPFSSMNFAQHWIVFILYARVNVTLK